jgi:hypothetical protein
MREELDGPAVSAFGVRSQGLSNILKGHRMGDQNYLSRTPPCFWRHAKLLVSDFEVVWSRSSFKEGCRQQAAGVKNIAESLSQHDEIMVYRPHLVR